MTNQQAIIEQLRSELKNLKRAHDALKKKITLNSVQSLALESANEAVAIFNLQGIFVYVNQAFCNLWGYKSKEEIIGKPIVDFWETPEKSAFILETINSDNHWTGDLIAYGKIGNAFEIQMSASRIQKSAGSQKNIYASFSGITNRKHAEVLQAENKITYRQLFNNIADAIFILNHEGKFIDVNDGAIKNFGFLREVLMGKDLQFISAPDKNDIASISSMLSLAFKGEPQQFDFWGVQSDGEIILKEIHVINADYFGEKVNIAIAEDISESKKAEKALQVSERRYRELIELAVDGILIGSSDGQIISANSYMETLTGRSNENLIGINVSELFAPDVLKNVPLRYDLLLKGETVFNQRDILRPDGTIIPIEMHTKMMPDSTYQSIYRNITERRKAEDSIRESEIKFKSLVESTSDMIWETNTEGLYTYLSPQFESLLGYSTEEAFGKSPFFFIADQNMPEIITNSDNIVSKAIPFNSIVNQYKHKDGQIVYFETSGVPVHDNAGNLKGYRGVSRNITKRYLAEKELHKLSLVVQQSPNTIVITNLQGKIEYVNPAGCHITGYQVNELLGSNPSIFSAGETLRETYEDLWKTILKGNEWKGIFKNKKKNGEIFWESAFIVPLRDAQGEVTHYLGVKEDITKRIQAEIALKESEERYRELFEGSPDAILLADIETGMLIDANPVAVKMLGRSLKQIKQLHQTFIHPIRLKEYSTNAFREHVEMSKIQKHHRPLESIVLNADGTEIPVEVLSNIIVINGRQILQGVFRDITERKQAREELLKAKEKAEASDKLKSAFLQNISHELRTPLNGIIGFSDMIAHMDNSPEDRIEFSKMIKKSSTRLINTVTSYMDISMIVSGIIEIKLRKFSLSQFMNRIYDQTADISNSRKLPIEIAKKYRNDKTEIETDEILLNKIFYHLIDNAVKFTKKGTITIGHELKNGYHQFFVSDTGKGISNESLSVIFEVFMQSDQSSSRSFEGSGLGLSIARGFVRLLGGEIWVESKNNVGSTFFFTIPEKNTISTLTSNPDINAKKLEPTILVAEDDDSNYKYIEVVLKKATYKVLRASDGFETIEMCRTHPGIKLVLTDLKMPGMDGFEATRQIKKILPDLPVVALSAYVSFYDKNTAMEAGCYDFIVKPVNKTLLLSTLETILQKNNF